ncbi:MAG: AAA family ATPase [Chloroflexota bacterium]
MGASSVTCPGCGQPAIAGKRFCRNCGNALPSPCPACGSPNPLDSSFCEDCGHPLPALSPQTPRSTPEVSTPQPGPVPTPGGTAGTIGVRAPAEIPREERRLITALFCDLAGFTPLSETLDPEDVRDIQSAYFEAMSEQIERYGGTVEKYAGDAVLALFGAPVAHEDDAERAVLCALRMQAAIQPVAVQAGRRWHVEPAIRVGVNTGEVVSGVWNAGGRQDVAVTGDAVNTAARIQAAAEPGEVLVGIETMRLTRRRIRYGERRDLVLKGKAGTFAGYRAIDVREQFGERWETSEGATPLVGRDRELVALLDAWAQAQGGDGQLVTLVGDAGVGKSRLITEFLEKVGASGAVRVLRARCLSYGQDISLWLVADLLRALFGIKEQDVMEEVALAVRAGVTRFLEASGEEIREEAIDVLGEVLGLPVGDSLVARAGAQVRRKSLIRNLRLLLRALSERAPTILVLEDTHWVDGASAQVITEMLSDVPGLRMLVLAAQRPGWTAPWTDWGWTERLRLQPLRDEEATLLATAVLGGRTVSPELDRYVAERAGGNPFFLEEILRALQETGGLERHDNLMYLASGAADRMPSTLTEVLLARLDRLDGPVRTVAQVASVIGRAFAVRLLAHVVEQTAADLDAPLTALQHAEIAFPRRGSDLEYVFKHVSMRDVAYNTLVQKRRQELHLMTARAIAQLYPSDEYVEVIAYHYGRTQEHSEAAQWLERAGDRAADVYANETAMENYQECRRRLVLDGANAIAVTRLDEKLGGLLSTTAGRYDEALELLARAADVYRRSRDLEGLARATAKIGWTHRNRGSMEEGITAIRQVLDRLSGTGPSHGLASLYLALSYLHFGAGRYQESLRASELASEMAKAVGDQQVLAAAEMRRGTALVYLGEQTQGMQVLEGSVPLLERAGDLTNLSIAFNNLGSNYLDAGDLRLSRTKFVQALEIGERAGDTGLLAFFTLNLAELLTHSGDWEQAEASIERSATVTQAAGAIWHSPYVQLGQGYLRLLQGRWEEAGTDLQTAISVGESVGDGQVLEYAHLLLGVLDVLHGRPEAALARLQPLTAENGPRVIPLLVSIAEAHLMMDSLDLAEETVVAALATVQERHEYLHLPNALRIQGEILVRRERCGDAKHCFDEAISRARSMPYPYVEGRALMEMGLMNETCNKPEQAREALGEALAIFRRLGASKDTEAVELALGRLQEASG